MRELSKDWLFISLTVLGFPLIATPPVLSETSIIAELLANSEAVVSIKAETGAIYKDKPQAFIHKETGQLLVHRKFVPVVQTQNGSGVIIESSGLIAANAHTIFKAARITVTLYDNTSYPADILHVDLDLDLAFLQIHPPRSLRFLKLSNSDRIKLDERVYSIGGSSIIKNTISEGIVSGIGISKNAPPNGKREFFRITFNLYQGDSGSPLLDERGNLLGIMSGAAINQDKAAYAIPSNKISDTFQKYFKELPAG